MSVLVFGVVTVGYAKCDILLIGGVEGGVVGGKQVSGAALCSIKLKCCLGLDFQTVKTNLEAFLDDIKMWLDIKKYIVSQQS